MLPLKTSFSVTSDRPSARGQCTHKDVLTSLMPTSSPVCKLVPTVCLRGKVVGGISFECSRESRGSAS